MFKICDETQSHHKKDMICTKTAEIGAVITYKYQYYGAIIVTCIIYIFSTCMIYFNCIIKSLGDAVNSKYQAEMKRVKMKLISDDESYNADDNVTVMVQVYVKKNFNFNYDFNWHFLRKLLLLLSLLVLCLRATTAIFYEVHYDIAIPIVFPIFLQVSSDIILYIQSESYDKSKYREKNDKYDNNLIHCWEVLLFMWPATSECFILRVFNKCVI